MRRFLSLHKFNIVQEELVELCKLLFELVILPDLDFNLQEKFARVLIKLLRCGGRSS
jgi:tRNA A22 N-methylase